jgi:cytochrome P450
MTTTASFPGARAYGELLDHATRPDPYPVFARLNRRPVQRVDEHTWTLGTHAEISRLLRDPRLSAADPETAETETAGGPPVVPFLKQDPPGHDHLRLLVMHQFVPRVLGMRGHIETLVDTLLDAHQSGQPGELDLVADLAYPLPVGVICDLLGVPPEDEPVFHAFAGKLTRGLDPVESLTPREQRELATTRVQFRAYLLPLIQRRLRDPGDDLISGLLAGDDPAGRMDGLDLAVTLGMLLIAGHETTVNLVANGTLALLRHPDVLARLRADPDLVAPVVEEVLRYDPPVQLTGRTALADIEVAGTTIPRGDRVVLLLAAGNRDPRRFAEPDEFWPERPDNAHLAFGGGLHYCLGAALARMEAQVALGAIAGRLAGPRLLADPPSYRSNTILRGPARLPVAFDRLDPALPHRD